MIIPATNKEQKSVVYSFEGRWESKLRKGNLKVFFRKRRPIELPQRAYFYVGVPVKGIIGFSEVRAIEKINLDQALKYAEQGQITEKELTNYIGLQGHVNAIWIENIRIFAQSVELSFLKANLQFNPPQSFSYVESSLRAALDCETGTN